ncbi:MAG TPA: YfhO family protein, partial [Actinomycetota bacterium]|nr:YfhO family protein [Actinomycetota bacterium]
GAGRAAAALAGVAYTFTGVNIVFIHRVSAQMVLPAMLWAAHRLVETPSLKRAAPLALFVAWSWFEGFPSAFVYCIYVTAAWCAWLMLRSDRWNAGRVVRRGLYVSAAFLLGISLSAINLIPFLTEVTSRGILQRRQYGADSHLPSIQFFGLFDLTAIGRYPEGQWWSGMNPVESISHFGMIAAAGMGLGLLGAVSGRLKLTPQGRVGWSFFCGLAVLGLVFNFVGGPVLEAAYQVPGIANNLITRSRFLLGLSAAILAALSVDSLWSSRTGRESGAAGPEEPDPGTPAGRTPDRARVPAPRLVSLATLLSFLSIGAVQVDDWVESAQAARQGDAILASAGLNTLLTGAALALVLLAWRRPKLAAVSAGGVAALLFFQLAFPLRNFTPSAPVGDYYSVQDGHRALKRLVGDDSRFAAAGRFTFSLNSGQIFRIPDLRGMALPSRQFRALGRALSPDAFAQDSLGIVIPRDSWDLSSPLLDDLAVGYFALGTEERPFGVLSHEDRAFDAYRPVDDGFVGAYTFTATGPISGVAVPIRGNQGCAEGSMTLSLSSPGRPAAVSSRPSFDVLSDWIHYGLHKEQLRRADWYWFALDGQDLRSGDRFNLALEASDAGCRLEVGALGAGPDLRPAIQTLTPDPAYPLRLVSTEQAWIYERPTAWDLVSAHSRWRAFRTQRAALAYAKDRPDEDRDVVAYVGRAVSPEPGVAPARLSSIRWGYDSVRFSTSGNGRSLVVVSQNADPGWVARIDGREVPIVKVDGALAGVFVPAGDHRVRLDYRPSSFVMSAWISGVAAVVLLAALIAGHRRRRTDDG